MASTTSLLKTQRSRQQTIWDQQDAIADYEWTLSDKSPEALQAYLAHYQDRLNNPQADPAKALSYTKKLTSANKAFTSNEIQRASIDIIEGRQPEQYKINVLENLYSQAYQNGDYDLAQSLRLQLDNQYVKMQNAALAGRGGGGGGGSASVSAAITAALGDVKDGNVPFGDLKGLTVSDIVNVLNEGGLNNAQDVLTKAAGGPDGLQKIFGDANVNPLQAIAGMSASMYDQASAMVQQITDPVEKAKALNNLNKQIQTDKITIGGKTFTLAELKAESDNISQGNPSIRFVSGPNGLVAQGRPTVDYTFSYDEQGNPVQLPNSANASAKNLYGDTTVGATVQGYQPGEQVYYRYNKAGGLEVVPHDEAYDKNGKSKLADQNGKIKDTKKYYDKNAILESAGFKVSTDGKTYIVADPRLREQLAEKGITESAISGDGVVVDSSGNVRFKTADGQLFQTVTDSFDAQGKGVTHIYDVKPQSTTDFISRGKLAPTTTNVLGTQMLTNLQNDISGASLQGANTSRYLQNAGGTSGILQQAASLQQLQNMKTEQLRVQALQAAPKLQVVAPYQPPTPIRVNQTVYQPPLKVQNVAVPQLTVTRPTAPTLSGSLQGGGGRIQGGTGSLQGGTGYFQGGTLRVQ